MQQILEHDKILSVIWLGMASKYLDHIDDESFSHEFDMIWQFWKSGVLT